MVDRLIRENRQPFVQLRGGERIGEVEGVKRSGQKINFGDVEVFKGDWLEDVRARAWLYVTDVHRSKLRNRVVVQVTYETAAQEERRRAEQEQRATQEFTFHAPAYGVFGSQQDFTFDQVIHELDRQIDERGGDDTEELRQMVAEIQQVLETQDSISRSQFQRWSELANKHFPWLMGPLGSLLVNYTFGGGSGAG
jgi:hypothetical protein